MDAKTVTRLCAGFSSRCVICLGLGLGLGLVHMLDGTTGRSVGRRRIIRPEPSSQRHQRKPSAVFGTRGLMIEERKERFAVGDRWRRMGWMVGVRRNKGRKGGREVREFGGGSGSLYW